MYEIKKKVMMFTKSKLFLKILAFVYFFFVPLRGFMKLGEIGRNFNL